MNYSSNPNSPPFLFSDKRWGFILALLSMGVILIVIGNQFRLIRHIEFNASNYYQRVGNWLLSADCSSKTNTFLTVCAEDGSLIPIEKVADSDDIGHTLIVNALAMTSKKKITTYTLAKINLIFTGFGLSVLVWSMYLNGLFFISFLLPSLLFLLGINQVTPDKGGCFIGAYALVIASLFLIRFIRRSDNKGNIFLFLLSCLLNGIAFLMRQPIGLIGILSSCWLLSIHTNFTRKHIFRNLSLSALMMGGMILMNYSPYPFFILRNKLFNLSETGFTFVHGISHNLYIGLGSEPNPWGIEWDDKNAIETVRKKYPNVTVSSHQYFRIIFNEYMSIWRSSSLEVARYYFKKTKRVAESANISSTELLFFALIAFFSTIMFLQFKDKRLSPPHCDSISAIAISIFLFLLQGLLAHPSREFLYPSGLALILFYLLLARVSYDLKRKTAFITLLCMIILFILSQRWIRPFSAWVGYFNFYSDFARELGGLLLIILLLKHGREEWVKLKKIEPRRLGKPNHGSCLHGSTLN